MALHEAIPCWIIEISDHLKAQVKCYEKVHISPEALFLIPHCLKTQEMCIEAVEVDQSNLRYVPGHFNTQEMCAKAVCMEPLF